MTPAQVPIETIRPKPKCWKVLVKTRAPTDPQSCLPLNIKQIISKPNIWKMVNTLVVDHSYLWLFHHYTILKCGCRIESNHFEQYIPRIPNYNLFDYELSVVSIVFCYLPWKRAISWAPIWNRLGLPCRRRLVPLPWSPETHQFFQQIYDGYV